MARGNLIIKYKAIYAAHEVFYLTVLMYGILVTVFKAIGTENICADTIKCGIAIWNIIMKYWAVITKLARIISGLCNKIPQQAVGNVFHNSVFVVITAITIMIPFGLLGYGVYQIGRYYRDNLWDRITLAVVLVSIGGCCILCRYDKGYFIGKHRGNGSRTTGGICRSKEDDRACEKI